MKNKNGFIATSLILTFFLLFCALLISVVNNYNFNQNLIDKLNDISFGETSENENENENKNEGGNEGGTIDIEVEAPAGWHTAASGTLLAGIKMNYNVTSEPLTTPGEATSLQNEAILAATEDDYGTSYYFRGNVENNYVAFANMCWRIVRITGDGSIKLVLYNYSSPDCTLTGTNLGLIRNNDTIYTTLFNTNYNDNAYIGLMYGTPGSSTYAQTHANIHKSVLLTNLETWYTNNIATYESKLADVIWCNDKSTWSGTGIGTTNTFYGAHNRANSGTPSLICPNDNNGGKLSKFTVNDTTNGNGNLDKKIGLLTLDEILFAGLKLSGSNQDYTYLKGNVSDGYWQWLLSPAVNYENHAYVFFMFGAGGSISNYPVEKNTSNIRPSLALKSSTTISSGNGTASSPFVVN